MNATIKIKIQLKTFPPKIYTVHVLTLEQKIHKRNRNQKLIITHITLPRGKRIQCSEK